eukprot:RCo017424
MGVAGPCLLVVVLVAVPLLLLLLGYRPELGREQRGHPPQAIPRDPWSGQLRDGASGGNETAASPTAGHIPSVLSPISPTVGTVPSVPLATSSESRGQAGYNPRLQPETLALPPENQCLSFVAQVPSNNGLGHSHSDRNNGLLLALRFNRSAPLCYAYMPLGESHHKSGKLFEQFFNFSSSFPVARNVVRARHLKRVTLKATKMSRALQELRRVFQPNVLYTVTLEMQVNHCLSVPVWRSIYWRGRGRSLPRPGQDCYTVAIHVRPRPFPSPKRELPPEYYSAVANSAVRVIQKVTPGRAVCTYLLTGPGKFDVAAVQAAVPGLEVHVNDSVTEIFHMGASADVLITSRSGFDHINAMFGRRDQLRLCAPMWVKTTCDDTWLTTTLPWGSFNTGKFARLWRYFHGGSNA